MGGDRMRAKRLVASFAIGFSVLAAVPAGAADDPGAPPADNPSAAPPQQNPAPQAPPPRAAPAPKEPSPPASVTIIGAGDAHGVLGRDVRSAANEDMGHIVDVIVDLTGRVRAAVIDFGGFLGVGSRRIVVDWNALRF